MRKTSCAVCIYSSNTRCRHKKVLVTGKDCPHFCAQDIDEDEKKKLTRILKKLTGNKNVNGKLKLFYGIFQEVK